MRHTPGPWRISKNELGYNQYDILTEFHEFKNTGICTLVDARFSNIHKGSVALDKDIISANAKLIASAPSMLETLKQITEGKGRYSMDHLEHASNTIEDMKQLAKDAIAKAEGDI